MKSVFAQFKKSQKQGSEPDTAASQQTDDLAQVHHSLGSPSKFLGTSKSPVLLSGILVLAIVVFAYRYFASAQEAPVLGPAPKKFHLPVAATAKDPALLARELFERKQLKESLDVYVRALADKPNDAHLWNDIGVLYLKNQRYIESEHHLRKSIQLSPNCAECFNNLGYLKTLTGDSRAAAELLTKASSLDAQYGDPYFNLGVLYEENGDFAHSANAYREFLNRSKDPQSPFNLRVKQHIESLEH